DQVVDADGNPVGLLTVTVHTDGDRMLWVAPGLPSHMTLDFDLAASNQVEFAVDGTSTVTVQPTLLADIDPQAPKVHRIRGPLKDVDEARRMFTLILRPFAHALSGGQAPFGALPVYTDADTVFDLSGTSYTGDAGLAALAGLPRFTAVVARGDLELAPRRFVAREVFAGSSVPGGDQDAVTGNVVSRTGDTAMIRGAALHRAGGQVSFLRDVEVTLGPQTTVSREGDPDAHDLSEVSVGQRVLVFGTLDPQTDPSVLAASHVRLLHTTLRGVVVSGAPLVLSLNSVDGRSLDIFDFAGTGTDPAHDADPAAYEVDPGTLPVQGLAVGAPVKVRGFVSEFSQAPPDFIARSLVDLGGVRALMTVGWNPASGTAIQAVDATGMDLSMGGAGLFHHVFQGFLVTDLAGLSPRIEPPANGEGRFTLAEPHRRVVYDLWEDFAADLADRLADGAVARGLVASGFWNPDNGTLVGDAVDLALQ
ncbi:MAG: metallophosphoesterase, partial [Pseudomonadota bacterium]